MSRTDLDRLMAHVAKSDGCWVWTAYRNSDGYGQAWHRGQMRLAHRAIYEETVAQVPEGLELDHLCRNPACVRPDHLEPVSHRENMVRGDNPAATHATRTHCPQGHLYSPDNTLVRKDGSRICRMCKRAHGRKRAAREDIKARNREANRRYRDRLRARKMD